MERCTDHEFAIWAFGDTWLEYLVWDKDSIDLMNAWNERHGELLMLSEDNGILESMDKMKELYLSCHSSIGRASDL